MSITLMFSVVAMKSMTFSVHHVLLMSRCTEAGRQHSTQITTLANGNVAYHKCNAQRMNGGWQAGRKLCALLVFHEFKSSRLGV